VHGGRAVRVIERATVLGCVGLFVAASACAQAEAPPSASPTPEPTIVAVAGPSATPSPAPAASPAGTPRVETSRIVLDVAIGPGYEQPAANAVRVGGVTSRGPMSFAVDSDGRIYVWDSVRVRILVYEAGRLARVLPEPFVDPSAAALLAHGGRLYLRYPGGGDFVADYEIDATSGDLLRLAKDSYPRTRSAPTWPIDKGPTPSMGGDLLGNTYQHERLTHGYEVKRLDRSGAVVAVGSYATTDLAFDTYITADGSVYDLRQEFDGGTPTRVRVTRVLGPAGAAPPESAAPITDRPLFAGRQAPTTIEVVAAPALPPATLTGEDAYALWWLLSRSWNEPAIATFPVSKDAYRLKASWPDGSSLDIRFDMTVMEAGTTRLRSALVDRALPHVLSRPRYSIDALRRNGGGIRMADVPSSERDLTRGEIDAFVDALGAAHVTTFDEHHALLEHPFPRRQLVVAYPAGTFTLEDAGDRWVQAAAGDGLAMFHDGRASTLLRQWLPTPSFARDDPAILFTAEKVTLPDQDISRWKASIVRALVLPSSSTGQGSWSDQGPLTFTFSLPGGRTEVVRVDAKGYTFAGRTYEKLGLLDLHGARGVP